MRRWLLLLPLLAIAGRAEAAKPVFFGWGGESFTRVIELPDTPRYAINDGYVDIGVLYKQVTIFFLPIWQYDLRWVIAPPGGTQYYAVDRSRIEQLARDVGATLPEPPPLGFWAEWGGKLVLGGGVLLVFGISALRRKRAAVGVA